MAIATLDGVIAGAQPVCMVIKNGMNPSLNRLFSTWALGGIPGAGTFNTTLAGGNYSSTGGLVTGQIPHYDPAGGLNSYLCRLSLQTFGNSATVFLLDRLWDNGGISITSTAVQTVGSPAQPARDIYGLNHGIGVLIGIEVSAACASTSNVTLNYTNEVGTAGRSTTLFSTQWTATNTGNFAFFNLQAGDQGVQTVQSLQLASSMTSGTINLVAVRVIAGIDAPGIAGPPSLLSARSIDAIKGSFQRIYNGSVPFLIYFPGAANVSSMTAVYQETQG